MLEWEYSSVLIVFYVSIFVFPFSFGVIMGAWISAKKFEGILKKLVDHPPPHLTAEEIFDRITSKHEDKEDK